MKSRKQYLPMGVPTGAARSKIQAREGTWSREYVLHQPLLRMKHGNHYA
jgi:hypothetical protein